MVKGIQRFILSPFGHFLRLCRAVYCWIFGLLAFSSFHRGARFNDSRIDAKARD